VISPYEGVFLKKQPAPLLAANAMEGCADSAAQTWAQQARSVNCLAGEEVLIL
jgi:hypothetical protein